MKLLTEELRSTLPHLYSQEHVKDPMVRAKFFDPTGSWTWYVLEGSPVDANGFYDTKEPKVDYLFFGLVDGFEKELGYFSLTELESVQGRFGLGIERDRYFKPCPLSSVR